MHGLVIAPGFIDMLGQSEYFLLVDGRAASQVMQGVTTEITGEGTSIAPINARAWSMTIPHGMRTTACFRTGPRSTSTSHGSSARPAINLGTFVGTGASGTS